MAMSAADARRAAQSQMEAMERVKAASKEKRKSSNANPRPVASTSSKWPGDDEASTSQLDAPQEKR